MAEKKTTPIVIDDVEYVFEDMSQKAQILVNQVADLDRTIGSTQFNLDQLQVGKQAFMGLLKEELAKPADGVEDGQLVEPTVQ